MPAQGRVQPAWGAGLIGQQRMRIPHHMWCYRCFAAAPLLFRCSAGYGYEWFCLVRRRVGCADIAEISCLYAFRLSLAAVAVARKLPQSCHYPSPALPLPSHDLEQQANRAPWPLMNLQWIACLALARASRGPGQASFPLYLHLFLLLFSHSFSSHTQSPTRLAICNVKHELAPWLTVQKLLVLQSVSSAKGRERRRYKREEGDRMRREKEERRGR